MSRSDAGELSLVMEPSSEEGFAQGAERSLLSALLFDGVQAYMNYLYAPNETHRSRYREAFNWVTSTEYEGPFCFESVCEALGFDPDYIRYGLARAHCVFGDEWRRSRRNF